MNPDLMSVVLFWGVWLLIPFLVDGISVLWHLWLAFRVYRFQPTELPPLPEESEALPRVSVVIPAYNEEINIDHCLLSLQAQTYDQNLIEVIVIDDGSEDATINAVLKHMGAYQRSTRYLRTHSFTVASQPFRGVLNIVRRQRNNGTPSGKPAAVNAGLDLVSGDLVIALDSDVVLAPDAIEQAVRAFLADPTMIAATGHLIIDPYLVYEKDQQGGTRLDRRGLPVAHKLNFSEAVLTACQFLEYVTAFHLGRRSESLVDSMFTLSGACAVYRREIFAIGLKYRARTVCEDADLTMVLHDFDGKHIGYLAQMHAHLRPILKWEQLYAQRVRWQRGALEVSAIHAAKKHRRPTKRLFWELALPLRLQIDHTMALPRLTWTFLIWLLPLFGYPAAVITQALLLILLLYLGINLLRTLMAYAFGSHPEKIFIRRYMTYLPLWPFYHMFLYWVRLDAQLRTLTESGTWTVKIPVLENLESVSLKRMAVRVMQVFFG